MLKKTFIFHSNKLLSILSRECSPLCFYLTSSVMRDLAHFKNPYCKSDLHCCTGGQIKILSVSYITTIIRVFCPSISLQNYEWTRKKCDPPTKMWKKWYYGTIISEKIQHKDDNSWQQRATSCNNTLILLSCDALHTHKCVVRCML